MSPRRPPVLRLDFSSLALFGFADSVACSLDLLDLRGLIPFCDILLRFTAFSYVYLSLVTDAVLIDDTRRYAASRFYTYSSDGFVVESEN